MVGRCKGNPTVFESLGHSCNSYRLTFPQNSRREIKPVKGMVFTFNILKVTLYSVVNFYWTIAVFYMVLQDFGTGGANVLSGGRAGGSIWPFYHHFPRNPYENAIIWTTRGFDWSPLTASGSATDSWYLLKTSVANKNQNGVQINKNLSRIWV